MIRSEKTFRFVSFRFVSFRFVSFRFVSFRFVSKRCRHELDLSNFDKEFTDAKLVDSMRHAAVRKPSFFAHHFMLNTPSICQDGLGTNTRKRFSKTFLHAGGEHRQQALQRLHLPTRSGGRQWVRWDHAGKKAASFPTFYTTNDHFAKTGSG
jgi:hypothetical protein